VNNILDALGGGQRTSSFAGLSAGGVTLDSLDHLNHKEGVEDLDGMTRELSILSTPGINKRSPVVGLGMTDGESSGVGSGTSAHSSASPTGSSIPGNSSHNDEYEHVYCQLDPYFVSFQIYFLKLVHRR